MFRALGLSFRPGADTLFDECRRIAYEEKWRNEAREALDAEMIARGDEILAAYEQEDMAD